LSKCENNQAGAFHYLLQALCDLGFGVGAAPPTSDIAHTHSSRKFKAGKTIKSQLSIRAGPLAYASQSNGHIAKPPTFQIGNWVGGSMPVVRE